MKNLKKHYALAWIDIFVSQLLHPDKNNLQNLNPQQLQALSESIKTQSLEGYSELNDQCHARPAKREQLIQHYYRILITICRQIEAYKNHVRYTDTAYRQILLQAEHSITELLQMLKMRYGPYLCTASVVSCADIAAFQTSVKASYTKIRSKYRGDQHHALRIVYQRLDKIIDSEPSALQLTHRSLHYKLKLLEDFIHLDKQGRPRDCHPIDRLLIYYNYNSKLYIASLLAQIENHLELQSSPEKKINELALIKKKLSQIQVKPQAILNPNYHDLTQILSDWLDQESMYYACLQPESGDAPARPSVSIHKVTCVLSTDQIALILRAADESKILQARSLNEVFKSIVPHLSTPRKSELSYRAVRNRIYNVEQADKEIAIGTLQQMIQKIQSY